MKIQFVICTNDFIIKISNKRKTNIKAKNDVLLSLKGLKTSEIKLKLSGKVLHTHIYSSYITSFEIN